MTHITSFPAASAASTKTLFRRGLLGRIFCGNDAASAEAPLSGGRGRYPTGHELVEKVWSALSGVPAKVMAPASPTGIGSKNFSQRNWMQKSLGTVCSVAIPFLIFALSPTLPAGAQAASTNAIETHSAMTIGVHGKCEYSTDGVTFAKLEHAHTLEQGAIVRTEEGGRVDLFFRRTGTVVRLQSGTEIKLETMSITMQDGQPQVHTLLDLRSGRIFTVVRHPVAGSTLEIKNKDGRAVVEGSGIGRYIITADGTHVAAERSAMPLKVVHENGITVLSAGQQFSKKDGKMLPIDSGVWVKELMQMDELDAVTETSIAADPATKP